MVHLSYIAERIIDGNILNEDEDEDKQVEIFQPNAD